MPAGARSRSSRRPSRSSEETGSSNQLTPSLARRTARRARAPACASRRRWRRRTARRPGRSPARARRTRSGSLVRRPSRPSSSRAGSPLRPSRRAAPARRSCRVGGEAARAVDRDADRAPSPSSLHSGRPSSRAFRSQSARSTAAIAIELIPGRPRLRICSTIAAHAACGDIASRAVDDARELRLDQLRGRDVGVACSRARARRRARACTTTIVVASHDERAVRLGGVGRDRVGADLELLDRDVDRAASQRSRSSPGQELLRPSA